MKYLSHNTTEYGDAVICCRLDPERLLHGMADLLFSSYAEQCEPVLWRLSPDTRCKMVDLLSRRDRQCRCNGNCIERVLGIPAEPTSGTETSLLCQQSGNYRIVYCFL
jgi:hypothetical protein